MSSDQLTSITEITELCQLRELYRQDWPHNCVGYYCIDNFIGWLQKQKQQQQGLQQQTDIRNLHIYTLNGDWRSEGLFVIVDRYQLFVNSLNVLDNSKLMKAISLLNWSNGFKVSSFRHCHRPAVIDVVKEKQLKVDADNLTLMYFLSSNEALKLNVDCPIGFKLQPLKSDDDAKTIDDLWQNKHLGSLFLIKRLIDWNLNMGVYDEKTNELVAWCLRLQGGFLGALHVKDSHKRRGLGALVCAATAKRIAEMGDDIMALVYPTSATPRRLFEKLGFKVIDKCYWLRTLPQNGDFEWPDGE